MIAFEKTAKVSSKGQITLPKQVRTLLHSDMVRIVVEDDIVRIEPVGELAGSLKRYANGYIDHKEAREDARSKVIRDKYLRD